MDEPEPKRGVPAWKLIRYLGITLFVLSFVAPSRLGAPEDFHLFGGLLIFLQTPLLSFQLITANKDSDGEHAALFAGLMMAAWVANLTVFTRMPRPLALIAMLLPWPVYVYMFSDLAGFLPFYPWAVGIALIHLSRWPKPVYGDSSRELQEMAPKG